MTILEQLQATHPEAEGISDARNIAEALACINGKSGRGANAIAAQIYETCEVTIDVSPGTLKDGTSSRVIRVKKGDTFTLPPDEDVVLPVNKEYLDKWSIINEGSIVGVYIEGRTVDITNNCRIKPIYGDSLTIYFDPNGANGSIDPIVIKPLGNSYSYFLPYGNSLVHPEGKTFVGWGESPDASYAEPGGTGVTKSVSGGTKPNTKTYYAIWQ